VELTLVMPVAEVAGDHGVADLQELARTAEDCGFGALAYSEHPAPSRKWLEGGGHASFDPLVALSFVAAATNRIRLMTLLLVLPYRNPLLTAKSVATLDVLSNGRLTVVAGAGYLRSEFLALGVDFDERNALLDEGLEVLDQAWASSAYTFEGPRFTAREQVLVPPPSQRPRPPVWIGGNSTKARARALRMGDGWAAIEADPVMAKTTRTASMHTVADVARTVGELRSAVADAGRDPSAFQVQLESPVGNFANHHELDDRIAHLQRMAAAGVDHTVIHPPEGPLTVACEFVRTTGARLAETLHST
jgi:probable F420-dependent oxidoreductase